jgi:hypothetical protein
MEKFVYVDCGYEGCEVETYTSDSKESLAKQLKSSKFETLEYVLNNIYTLDEFFEEFNRDL